MTPPKTYPFAQEFIIDANGQIQKVVLSLDDYQTLLEALEDEGLYRFMQQVRTERPLDRASALKALDE